MYKKITIYYCDEQALLSGFSCGDGM